MLLPLELKSCKSLWLGEVVWAGISAGLLGKRPTTLGQRQTWPKRSILTEYRGVEPGVNMLGCQYWLCGVECGPVFMLRSRGGKWCQPAPSLEWGLCPWCFQRITPGGANSLPAVCPMYPSTSLSTCCLFWGCFTVFSLGAVQHPRFYPSQPWRLSELQALGRWCRQWPVPVLWESVSVCWDWGRLDLEVQLCQSAGEWGSVGA